MRGRIFLAGLLGIGALNLTGVRPVLAEFQPQPCKNAFSIDQEIAEGKKAAVAVEKEMPVLPDSSQVSQYVAQLGAKLVANAPGYKWPYEFHVVNDASINAFALPGGPIFINLGTLLAVDTEGQLAGVMAHEISHVVQRHATCNQTKQQTPRLLAGLGQLAAGILVPGAGGMLAAQGIGAAAGLGFLRMSREAEKEADLMGVDILYKSGYDPRSLPQFFEVIQGKYGSGGQQFLSDHPNPGNRTEYVNAEIATLPAKTNYIRTSAAFTRMKKEIKGMHAYSAKEIAGGAWKGPTAGQRPAAMQPVAFSPNGIWKQLGGAGFSLSYPGNWTATASGDSATIAPVGGVSDGVVAYGVLVDRFNPQPTAEQGAAFDQLVKTLTKQNPGMQTTGTVEDVLVNKLPGKSVEMTSSSPVQQNGVPLVEHDWVVGIARDDGTLSTLVFVAPGSDAKTLHSVFEQMLRTFKVQ